MRAESGNGRSDAEEAAAIRYIRDALLERLADGHSTVITVTSAAAGAGNTTVATLLARSLAAAGCRLLLVDANPHRPAVTLRLGVPEAGQDLLSALSSASPLEFVRKTQTTGLDVLGLAAPLGPGDTALLAAKVGTLLARLCERHELVLVDGPPLPGDPVALSLACESDAVIFVAREGHCLRSDIAEALAALRTLGARLAGTVFNATTAGAVGAPS
ncbi:MAG: CpsD/CapB family tyrosine-protein kinase [Phycisphaerae bacterium]|nr:CpsD/CapB family tyrosine-protein kinase [Phycisphaerae bacterium]